MRPRRNVVLYSRDPERMQAWRFALETSMHVTIFEASDPEVVGALLSACDVALVLGTRKEFESLSSDLGGRLLWAPRRADGDVGAVMEVLKRMLARKRGPKPGAKRAMETAA